ncbi:MAG: choice-of-anchor L domain-containing protein, partial [Bacteroidales bacterium]|nr:choice-of-anchor L domain-containing protein [Bacteroidales bacterium]
MKKTLLFFVSICIGFGLTAQNNKLTLTSVNGLNVDTVLKRHLEGPGVKITDGQFNMSTGNISGNNSNFIGRFTKQPNANFPFQKGLYMKTGDNSYYDGNNTFTSLNLTDLLAPGQRLGYGPTDSRGGGGSALDFNFVALSDTFAFNYVFASSEYTNYTCSNYNDIFAFFLEGWDYVTLTPTTRNVAVVPNTITANNPTGIPVAINTINGGCTNSGATVYYDGTYSAYFTQSYNNSYPSDFGGLNGSTVALTAESRILACQTYKMHLAISNVNDHTLNSAVFLEEGSFYSPTVEIVQEYDNNNTGGDTLIQNCRECDLTFKLPIAPETPISVGVSVGGGAVLNQDFELELPDGTLLNPTNNNFSIQGSLEESLHMKILPNAAFSPGQVKEVKVYFVTTPCLALADLAPNDPTLRLYDTLTFYLRGNDSVKIQQGITLGACDTLKSMNVNLLRGNPTNFTWTPSTGILTPNSMSPSTAITQSGTYKLVASDPWNCMKDSTEIEVNIVEKPD